MIAGKMYIHKAICRMLGQAWEWGIY